MSDAKPSPDGASRIARRRADRRPLFLMLSLFLLLLLPALVEGVLSAVVVRIVLYALILLSALYAVHTHRRQLIAAFLLGGPWLVISWLPQFREGGAVTVAGLALMIAFTLFVLVLLLRSLLLASHVTLGTLYRAISTYLLIAVAWTAIYVLLSLVVPDAFRYTTPQPSSSVGSDWDEMQYFSFITLTTLGYGDITPVASSARAMAAAEATIGPLYIAMLIARLVAMHGQDAAVKDR